MNIILNGEEKELKDGLAVADLLKSLKLKKENVAVEINMVIIKKTDYENTVIRGKDKVEVVHFVGGG